MKHLPLFHVILWLYVHRLQFITIWDQKIETFVKFFHSNTVQNIPLPTFLLKTSPHFGKKLKDLLPKWNEKNGKANLIFFRLTQAMESAFLRILQYIGYSGENLKAVPPCRKINSGWNMGELLRELDQNFLSFISSNWCYFILTFNWNVINHFHFLINTNVQLPQNKNNKDKI